MQGCYRWHLGDNIPFTTSLKMTIENYTGFADIANRNDYSSVAYWYQLPGGSDFFTDTPVADRIPHEYVVPVAIEVERYLQPADLPDGMSIIEDDDLPKPLSRGRGVKLVGQAGSTFTLNIPAKVNDRYTFRVQPARGVKASDYQIVRNGRVIADRIRLKKGPNPVTIRLTGQPVEGDRCELIIDYVTAQICRNLITNWLWIGPFPNPDGKGLGIVYPPERKFDVSGEYMGRDGKPVGWRKISRPDGIIMLNDLIRPMEHCVIYAACTVNAPTARKDTLLIGSDDGVKVWINDKLVWKHGVERRMMPDSDRVDVTLAKGENLLLIKIEQRLGDIGFALRFHDPEDELTFGLPK